MHRITQFNLEEQYNEYVDPRVIEIMKEKVTAYNLLKKFLRENEDNLPKSFVEEMEERLKKLYLEVLYTNPAGFKITARMTTNYRCLRNIYKQRKDHRLPEWREFCKWIESLPYAEEFLIN
jgi:hypothetical protein